MTLVIKKPELEEFYKRWNIKAEEYSLNGLSNYFDKFFTLYVIFNGLYNIIVAVLESQGKIEELKNLGKINKNKENIPDNKAATVCVAYYLKQDSLAIIDDLQTEILDFKNIIQNKLFYIDVNFGKPQRAKDLKLLKRLNSTDNYDVLESLLIILYKLRCNTFHGEKGFDMEQEIILEPSISTLAKLNRILNSKIMQE